MKTNPNSARTWYCMQCTLDASQADQVGMACFDLGSCGLQTEDDGPYVRLSAYFPSVQTPQFLHRALADLIRPLGLNVELRGSVVVEEDWGTAWRQHFRPVWATSRIVIHPPWLSVKTRSDQLAIIIDPKMAFGTGGHESTRLCLSALEDVIRPGVRCLDLGVGSGILTIAALRMGAGHVVALDVDPAALLNARENLLLNGCDEQRTELRQGTVEEGCEQSFQVSMANIRSSVLTPLLPLLARNLAPDGDLLLSGLLGRERDEFSGRLHAAGLVTRRVLAEGEWICVVARRARTDA